MFYIDYGDRQVLGDENRAEQMVLWSRKQITGKTVSKKWECGLTVKLVADDSEPKVYLFWDQNKFNKFSNGYDTVVRVYGLDIVKEKGNTSIIIRDSSEEGSSIFAFEGEDNCPILVLGMICLLEQGPHFFTEQECQTDITDLKIQVEAEVLPDTVVEENTRAVTMADKLANKELPDIKIRLLSALKDLGVSSRSR